MIGPAVPPALAGVAERRPRVNEMTLRILLAASLLALPACATLGGLASLVQPPRFERIPDRDAELRLRGPGGGRSLGGASLRLWTRVYNPNSFGLTLAELKGDLFLDDTRAAEVDFPLGLPLAAQEESEVPIDISIGFDDLPGLGRVASAALGGGRIDYRLDGTIGVDAGALGRPVFGPATLLRGDVRVLR
jgi:late embryogenesis abundant protein